jgi:tripeptidyl-peptidase-1
VKLWLQQTVNVHEDEIVEKKGWLAVDLPAREAELLFNTEYFEYGSSRGDVRVGCDRYCIYEFGG